MFESILRLFGLATVEPFKNCGGCHYYDKGACRRYPPARVYTGDQSKDSAALDVTVWPVVLIDNWCGEWTDKA